MYKNISKQNTNPQNLLRMETTTITAFLINPWLRIGLLALAVALAYLLNAHSTSIVDKILFGTGVALLLIVVGICVIPQDKIVFVPMLIVSLLIFVFLAIKHLPLRKRASKYEENYG